MKGQFSHDLKENYENDEFFFVCAKTSKSVERNNLCVKTSTSRVQEFICVKTSKNMEHDNLLRVTRRFKRIQDFHFWR